MKAGHDSVMAPVEALDKKTPIKRVACGNSCGADYFVSEPCSSKQKENDAKKGEDDEKAQRCAPCKTSCLAGFDLLETCNGMVDNACVRTPTPAEKCNRMLNQTSAFISILENNTQIMEITNNNALGYNLMTPNVKARITPFGNFYGFNAVFLYFFTLKVQYYNIVNLTTTKSFCNADTMQTALVVNYARVALANPDQATRNLALNVFLTFDSLGLITSIDSDFLNPGLAYGAPPAFNDYNINGICTLTLLGTIGTTRYSPQGTCIGENAIWKNNLNMTEMEYCLDTLTNVVPYGTFDRANSNTIVCRILHSHLSTYNPAVHCPHVSPSGGQMCIDWSYESYFTNNNF